MFEVKGYRAKALSNRHVKASESVCYVCIQMHRLPFCITTASGTSVLITIIKRISRSHSIQGTNNLHRGYCGRAGGKAVAPKVTKGYKGLV